MSGGSNPLNMFYCSIGLHLQNTELKADLLRISNSNYRELNPKAAF